MAKRKINSKSIKIKLSKNKKVKKAAFAKARKKFNKFKTKMIGDFNNHVVTKEIQLGPLSTNASATLRGQRGNLYTYIGFPTGTDPIGPVLSMMESMFSLSKRPKRISVGVKNIKFMYRVLHPGMEDFESVSPMPWEGGSWIYGIEKGISGYSHYMYKRSSASRSGSAIQTESPLRMGSFKPMDYVSKIIRQFRLGIIR